MDQGRPADTVPEAAVDENVVARKKKYKFEQN